MRARTFRTRLWLRVAVFAAATWWAAVAMYVISLAGAGAPAALGAVAFVLLFGGYAARYERSAVLVTPDAFVFRTLFRRVQVRPEDILNVRVVRAVGGTLYAVFTRRGLFRFTSLFAQHRELLDLLLQRARLQRGC
jgi:hypothetical protein